jgi:hypothetical protein
MTFKEALSKAIDKAEKNGTLAPKRAEKARKNLAAKSAAELKQFEGRAGMFAGAGKAGAIDWEKFLPLILQLLPIILKLFGL